MNVRWREIHFKRIFLFASITCGIFGIVFSAQHIYAAVLPSSLPDAVKKKVGIGKTVSISGWAWNGAIGWVSQRGAITGGGAYGIIKDTGEGVSGWSWSANYGWICWGKTCSDPALSDISKYGNQMPTIRTDVGDATTDPDVFIEPIQVFPIHGDGTVEGTEQCDHGTTNGASGDSCSTDGKGIPPVAPKTVACGNGVKETGEVCDDGDLLDTNACKNDCSGGLENSCGNGIKEGTEECDDGDRDTTNACKNDCTRNGSTLRQNEYAFPVSGWIKVIGLKDDGWISLRGKVECDTCLDKGKEYNVIYDPDHKEFRGWAWSPKFGWMVFSGRTLYDTEYRYAKVTPPGGSAGSEKQYDVTEYTVGAFRILTPPKNGYEREYLLEKKEGAYQIKSVSEFQRNIDGTVNNATVRSVDPALWDTVEVFDETACQKGCDISYISETKKSTWKTQLLSPWIQTAGGNVFSRKGFGGSAVAFRPSSQYLLYSGGVTLDQDLREGEKFELACCTNNLAIITKIGAPETIENVSYQDLSDGGELEIIKNEGKIKKKKGGESADTDIATAFSSLLEGEERRLKKDGNNVKVNVVYPLYASVEQSDMKEGDTAVIIRGSDGKLKKDGIDIFGSLKTAFSKEKRIVGALTSWTSECDDPAKKCSPVGRKNGSDIKKADVFNRESRPDIAFPQKKQNVRRNTLGSLDIDKLITHPDTGRTKNTYGYTVVSINDEKDISRVMTAGLHDTIFVKDGDLSIGGTDVNLRGEFVFKNGTASGRGTIIVNGGNLHIYRPLRYESGTVSDIKKLASVAWIVLKKDGKGGNIIFDDCIPPTSMTIKANDMSITQSVASAVGIFFAEGTISTGKGDGGECSFTDGDLPLYVDGMMIARKFNFQRVYSGDPDLNLASEFIQDTGRAVVNTPPGLEDILKSLPAW